MLTPSRNLIKDSVDSNEDSSEAQRKAQEFSRLINRPSIVFNGEELRGLGSDFPPQTQIRTEKSSPARTEHPPERQETKTPIKTQLIPSRPQIKFVKAEVKPILSSGHGSTLSALLKNVRHSNIPSPVSQYASSPTPYHKSLTVRIYFEEFEDAEPHVFPIACPMTIGEVINLIVFQGAQRTDINLVGDGLQYELRYYEDDDGIDYDLPPISRDVDIFDVGQELMALCRRTQNKKKSVATNIDLRGSLAVNSSGHRDRGLTLPLNMSQKLNFVKIFVIGPHETQNVIKVADTNVETVRVRDLYSLLNRKLGGKPFSSAYFGLYYKEDTFNPIELSEPVQNLRGDKLYLLPREIDLQSGTDDWNDAMEYDQVSMLRYKEFPVSKIMPSYRKRRMLGVDKYRIIKIVEDRAGVSLFQKEHLPINIEDIEYINPLGAPREFEIGYRHPSGTVRKQIYECKTSNVCEEFVNRVRYLQRYNELRPGR